jgi:ribA/ribD-fused uncharacterized protein
MIDPLTSKSNDLADAVKLLEWIADGGNHRSAFPAACASAVLEALRTNAHETFDPRETIDTLRYELEQFATGANLTDRQRARLREIARTEVKGGAVCRNAIKAGVDAIDAFHEAEPADPEKGVEEVVMSMLSGEIHHGLDTPDRVCFYEQDFYVLSNFSSFQVKWLGMEFMTSEHVYHWEKFRHTDLRAADAIRDARSAHDALMIATSLKSVRRRDWDTIKVIIMREILRAKAAQHEYVRRKLLQTGTRELVENSWRDDFWGWGTNRDGNNMLGKLWMDIRDEMRSPGFDPTKWVTNGHS